MLLISHFSFLPFSQRRKQDHLPDRLLPRQRHHQPVDADPQPARRRHPVLQRNQEILVRQLRLERVLERLWGDHCPVEPQRVADPAGGSYFVESLTDQLAVKAWARVQELEAAGGMAAALASGLVARQIEATNAARARLLATRNAPITGVSMFPLTVARLRSFTARGLFPLFK